MSWVFDYEVDSVDLLDYCSAVVLEDEGGSGFSGNNINVGFLDGERWEEKTYAPLNLALKTVLRWTDDAGAITHADGAAGHVYENLSELKLLFGQPGLKYLQRDAPDYGLVRAQFELGGSPFRGQARHVFVWPLRVPSGSWQTVTQSTATGSPPSVTTGGNRRIFDPEIVLSGAGSFTYTNAAGKQYQIVAAAGPTFPVTLSVDRGEWLAVDNSSADAWPYVTVSQPDVMVFDPDSSLSLAATVSTTVRWRDRWA